MGDPSSIGEVLRSETSFVPSPGSCPGKPSLTSSLSAATNNSNLAMPDAFAQAALELDAQVFFVVTGRMIDQRSIDIFTGSKILFKSSVVFASSLCLTEVLLLLAKFD